MVEEDPCRSRSPVSCTGVFQLRNCMEVDRKKQDVMGVRDAGCFTGLQHRFGIAKSPAQEGFHSVPTGHDGLLQGFVEFS